MPPEEKPAADDPEEGSETSPEEGAGKATAEEQEAEEQAEEEEEEVLYADLALPTLDELRTALDWAFEKEEVESVYLDRCADHSLLVQEANRHMNLTKIVDPKEIAAKHYLDCWRVTQQLPLLGKTILDLGSGAGYPGVPVALAEPNAHVTLIDSTKKKADFLEMAITKLAIPNATAVWDRAEEHLLRNRYDLVILRAISSVRENVRLLRKVRHSLKDLAMLKGPSWSREVRAGEREAERLGFRLDTVWEHELPGEMGARAVLVYRAPGGQGM